MTEPVDVLAVAAHPDDAELGCGGALLLAADAGLRTAVVDLTDGELSTRGTPALRARERDEASRLLGLAERVGLGLPDGGVGTGPGHRLALVEVVRRLRPRVVVAPWVEDRHPDHAAAGVLARAACFLAGVGRYGGDAGEPHRPPVLCHYMVHTPFTPTFVVDVEPVWDRKTALVEAYGSQFGSRTDRRPDSRDGGATAIATPRFVELVEDRASWFGATVGVRRGEPFTGPGPVGLPGLPGLGPVPLAGDAPLLNLYH